MWALATTISRRTHRKSNFYWALGLTVAASAAATVALVNDGKEGLPMIAAVTALFCLMAPYSAFLATSFARDVGLWLRGGSLRLLQILGAFIGVYLIYAIGTDSFTWSAALRLSLFVGIPMALAASVRGRAEVTWQDFVAVACIWLPFDTGLLKEIWTWPDGGGAYILNTALAVNLAVILFVAFRGLAGVSPRFRIDRRDLRLVVLTLVGFMAVALPFGFGTGFITWNPNISLLKLVATPIGIFLFIALPEELLFRGLVQNMITRRFGRPGVALFMTAVIFGATHLNNGPAPDWRYFVLATYAGVLYGMVYQKTRGLAAPAILHALVDTLWVSLFHT